MYSKIFSQIMDSSLAEDYQVRHIFMDLIVLADKVGEVDMTLESIARRTNMPKQLISEAMQKLCQPDLESRSKEADGRRLIPIDPERSWGWRIVNYVKYRDLKNENERREYHRDYMARWREERKAREDALNPVNPCEECEKCEVGVRDVKPQTHPHPQAQVPPIPPSGVEGDNRKKKRKKQADERAAIAALPIPDILRTPRFIDLWAKWQEARSAGPRRLTLQAAEMQLAHLAEVGEAESVGRLKQSMENNWQGLFFSNERSSNAPPEEPQSPEPTFETRAARLKYEAEKHTSGFGLDYLNEWAQKHHGVDDIEQLNEKQMDELLIHLGVKVA